MCRTYSAQSIFLHYPGLRPGLYRLSALGASEQISCTNELTSAGLTDLLSAPSNMAII